MKIGAFVFGAAAVCAAAILYCFGGSVSAVSADRPTNVSPALQFKIDPASSKFMVRAHRGGLAWFKGHDHYIAVRDFDGKVEMALDVLNPASLTMSIRAD